MGRSKKRMNGKRKGEKILGGEKNDADWSILTTWRMELELQPPPSLQLSPSLYSVRVVVGWFSLGVAIFKITHIFRRVYPLFDSLIADC